MKDAVWGPMLFGCGWELPCVMVVVEAIEDSDDSKKIDDGVGGGCGIGDVVTEREGR